MILLIWEEVPDNTTVYLLQDLTVQEANKIRACHNQFINSGEGWTDEVEWLSEYLIAKKPNVIYGHDIQNHVYTLSCKGPLDVVVSGFLC